MAIIDGVSVSGTVYGLRDNDTSGGIAPTFSTFTAYTAGQYVWYDSGSGAKLYRFTANHAAGAWTGTDATEVKLGNDVSELKSTISSFEIITTNATFASETIDETETEDVDKYVKLTGEYKQSHIYNIIFIFNSVNWKSNNSQYIQIKSYSEDSISSTYVVDSIRASTEVVDGNQLRVTYSPTTDTVKMIGCIFYLGAGSQDIEINVEETYSPVADDVDDLKKQAENIAPLVDVSENAFTGTVSGSYAVMYVPYNFYKGNKYRLNLVCSLGTEEVNNCLRINTSLVQNAGSAYRLDIINAATTLNPLCGKIDTFGTGDTIVEEFVATQNAKYLVILYYGKENTNYQHKIIVGRIATLQQIDQIVLGRGIIEQNKDVEPYILQFGREISAQTTVHSINRLNFLFFSDIHAKADLWNRICDYMDEYSNIIPFAIHAGDYVSNDLSASNVVDLYGIRKPKNGAILNTVGNHDCYPAGGNSPTAPIADVYAALYASVNPVTDGWDCTFGSEQYSMYWYKDVAESKIRIVCFDQYHWTDDQATFVANALSGAITNEYAVITVTHTPITTAVTDIGSGFWTLDNWVVNDTYSGSMVDIRAAINTFINNGGNHLVHLCGHIHSDQIGTLTDDGILQIRIQTASAGTNSSGLWTDTNRVLGTKTYDCFDIMQIDQNLGMLKLVRIGCNSSDCLQPRTTLCWDYVNKRLIANE